MMASNMVLIREHRVVTWGWTGTAMTPPLARVESETMSSISPTTSSELVVISPEGMINIQGHRFNHRKAMLKPGPKEKPSPNVLLPQLLSPVFWQLPTLASSNSRPRPTPSYQALSVSPCPPPFVSPSLASSFRSLTPYVQVVA